MDPDKVHGLTARRNLMDMRARRRLEKLRVDLALHAYRCPGPDAGLRCGAAWPEVYVTDGAIRRVKCLICGTTGKIAVAPPNQTTSP